METESPAMAEVKVNEEKNKIINIPGINIVGAYGDWMKVRNFPKKRFTIVDPEKTPTKTTPVRPPTTASRSGSRFDVLASNETSFVFNASPDNSTKKDSVKKWKKKDERERNIGEGSNLKEKGGTWLTSDYEIGQTSADNTGTLNRLKTLGTEGEERLTSAAQQDSKGSNVKGKKKVGTTKGKGKGSLEAKQNDVGSSSRSQTRPIMLGKRRSLVTYCY